MTPRSSLALDATPEVLLARPSKSAQADLEPRPSPPQGGRPPAARQSRFRGGRLGARRRPTALHAWLLAALLLAAQALGLAHSVSHAPGLGQALAAAGASGDWPDGHAADSPECRLIAQLGHADGLCTAAPAALPGPFAAAAPAAAPAHAPQPGSAAAYQARAPPPARQR